MKELHVITFLNISDRGIYLGTDTITLGEVMNETDWESQPGIFDFISYRLRKGIGFDLDLIAELSRSGQAILKKEFVDNAYKLMEHMIAYTDQMVMTNVQDDNSLSITHWGKKEVSDFINNNIMDIIDEVIWLPLTAYANQRIGTCTYKLSSEQVKNMVGYGITE